ncbi:MAG: diacylglycerol kinase family lipid kinase [Anaerolineales bacterium]|nr:diacylglycerol kinase family lipid kinase [Anaerolineales bacterium]MCB9005529.1 diacylglycerol kinase family lipid kinase [Ardenticatenaceae bacterium]
MNVKVILNPYANRWRAQARANTMMAALQTAGLTADLAITEKPGQGIDLARQAVLDGYEAVLAAGGDGTINEVINGVLQATPDGKPTLPFGIMPIGTANDFAKMQNLPLDMVMAAQAVAACHTHQIDAGVITGSWGDAPRYFVNNSAAAMEPMITIENIRMKRLSGEMRYMAALVKGLFKLKAWQMQIKWDGGGHDGPAYLLSVCNGPRTGGFQMAPNAEFDDGLFDFVFAPEVSKLTVIAVLLKLMKGEHIHHPAVTYARTAQLTLTSEPGTPIHADGEVFVESATAVSYRILPGKITLITATDK